MIEEKNNNLMVSRIALPTTKIEIKLLEYLKPHPVDVVKNNTVMPNGVLHLVNNELEFIEYKRAAKQFFNEIGEWSYDEWKSHNAVYFDNALKVGAIVWGLTPFGSSVLSRFKCRI